MQVEAHLRARRVAEDDARRTAERRAQEEAQRQVESEAASDVTVRQDMRGVQQVMPTLIRLAGAQPLAEVSRTLDPVAAALAETGFAGIVSDMMEGHDGLFGTTVAVSQVEVRLGNHGEGVVRVDRLRAMNFTGVCGVDDAVARSLRLFAEKRQRDTRGVNNSPAWVDDAVAVDRGGLPGANAPEQGKGKGRGTV